MHIIDPIWTDLAAGHQAVMSLQASLEIEFGRAVQTGRKQKFRRELTGWQKKRRAFFAMAALAPLSILALCLAAYFVRDAACVIIYWAMLVVIILVTLAVAGRNYIQEALNRPTQEHSKTLPVALEQRWWERLSPQASVTLDEKEKKKADWLTMLGQTLPETCLTRRTVHPVVLSPAGIWLLQSSGWSGTIRREAGAWKLSQTVRDPSGRKQNQVQTLEPAPDEEWLRHKNELLQVLNERLPERTWTGNMIQGGVVFTDPKVQLDKAGIQGNTSAYGTLKAWAERIRRAPAAEAFSLESQLEILDALPEFQDGQAASAKEEAERLYREAADELHSSVVKMVN